MHQQESVTHVIERLRRRAGSQQSTRPRVNPNEVRQLLMHWKQAERAGIRFLSDGLLVNGTQFELGTDSTDSIRSSPNRI
jgi:hypothetical protein